MVSPAWLTEANAQLSTAGTLINVSRPSGTVDGDLLICHVVVDIATAIGSGGAFTELDDQLWASGGDDAQRRMVGWLIAASEPTSYAFTWTGAGKAVASIHRISGHHATTPIAVSGFAEGSTGDPRGPSVDPGSSQDYLAVVCCGEQGKRTFGRPFGYTERIDHQTGGGGAPTLHVSASIATRAYTGQVETPDAFIPSGSDEWIASTIIIAPAGAGGVDITLVVAIVASSAQALTVTPARLIALAVATVVSTARAVVVSRAEALVTLVAASAASSAQALTVSRAAQLVTLVAASVASSAQALTVLAARAVNLVAASVASSAQALTVSRAAQLVTLVAASVASSAQALTVLAARAVNLVAASVASSARTLAVNASIVLWARRWRHNRERSMRYSHWRRRP